MQHAVGDLLCAWHDLVLGGRCSVCAEPGPALCRRCGSDLRPEPFPAWPTPTPAGLLLPVAAAEYAGAVREIVVAHKERNRLALARPLGKLLAAAVADVLRRSEEGSTAPSPGDPVLLVPVPSHPAVVRSRRHDPLLRVARSATAVLRDQGVPARVDRRLRLVRRPEDQAGLGARSRSANVRGTMRARPRVPVTGERLVLVDDVITTGATLREAQRAMGEAGRGPLGAATVAATQRRGTVRGSVDFGVRLPDG